MKKLEKISQLKSFKAKYESISNLRLPLHYLRSECVFGFFKKGELVGGFILGNQKEHRTIQAFVEEEQQESLLSFLGQNDCVEVCCFWMKKTVRKKKLFNLMVWLKMGMQVYFRQEPYVIYGTNLRGLAKMYGYPKPSILIHQGFVNGKNTFVFLAKRKDFIKGTLEILKSKILSKVIDPRIEISLTIKNQIKHELST